MHRALALICCIPATTAFIGFGKRQLATGFNAAQQHIDVSGAHAFIAPGASDLRGPCPAMNSLANHGYIARNGYTTLTESSEAIQSVLGAGSDLSIFLATLGAVQAGDGFHFSIGGPPPSELPILGGLLGQPQGLSNSHNRFEGDASPCRGDLYQFGEAYLTQMPFFQGMYDLPGTFATNPDPNYDIPLLGNYAVIRQQESVSQNPYYFRGPVGFFIPPGTHAFIFRMFANKSAAYPDGFLDRNTLKSFYAMSGEEPSLTYTPGNERIPENWYTRAAGDEYTIPLLLSDLGALALAHPDLANFGGNTGTVNSFAGLDVSDLTGGAYNAETLLEGNNLGCLLFQSAAVAAPDLIRNAGVIADVIGAVNQITSAVNEILSGLGCPALAAYNYNESLLSEYPGYTKLKSNGTY